jgi:hypothetical protein
MSFFQNTSIKKPCLQMNVLPWASGPPLRIGEHGEREFNVPPTIQHKSLEIACRFGDYYFSS